MMDSEIQTQPKDSSSSLPVTETSTIVRDVDDQGNKMVNQYSIIREIGRGVHGKVKLVQDTNGEQYALKVLAKNPKRRLGLKLSNKTEVESMHRAKIKREIAIMKKCCHKHIVRLKEVIDSDDSDKIYFVLEYLSGGEVKWVHPDSLWPDGSSISMYTESDCRKMFRDIVAGVQYLHHQGIVHRDIKPANMLWSAEGRIKLSDFGVSVFVGKRGSSTQYLADNTEAELSKTAGSPAFFPPELCNIEEALSKLSVGGSNSSLSVDSRRSSESATHGLIRKRSFAQSKVMRMMLEEGHTEPPLGSAIDIWAIGVSLYCFVFGRVPFTGNTEFELFHTISKQPLELPEHIPISENLRDLFMKILDKDPVTRITMEDIKFHPWTTEELTMEERLNWLSENSSDHPFAQPLQVTDEEVSGALTLTQKLRRGIRNISSSFSSLASLVKMKPVNDNMMLPIDMGYLPLSLEQKVKEIANGTEVVAADWVKWDDDKMKRGFVEVENDFDPEIVNKPQ